VRLVACLPEDAKERILAGAVYVTLDNSTPPEEAEIAFTVADDYHGLGLGSFCSNIWRRSRGRQASEGSRLKPCWLTPHQFFNALITLQKFITPSCLAPKPFGPLMMGVQSP
jgi:hypothetical protein